MTLDEARRHLDTIAPINRLGVAVTLARQLRDGDAVILLVESILQDDAPELYRDNLGPILAKRRTLTRLMTDAEDTRFDSLPDVVTVYRSWGPGDALRWALDPHSARRYAGPDADAYLL